MNGAMVAEPGGYFRTLVGRVWARLHQHSIDRLGRGTRLAGRLHVQNDGFIRIGEDGRIGSHPIQSHMVAMPDARITIGDRVFISYGAAISARCSIQIGDDTRIGPFSLIMDNDFHRTDDLESLGDLAPIEIGRRVTIGARVTILRGARVGDGACIMSGSTVSGVIASGSVVAGVPARVGGGGSMRSAGPSVAVMVMRTFRLPSPPRSIDGPAQIPGWGASGAVRLLVALEEAFGITLPEGPMRSAGSVAEVAQLVALAREK